MNVNLDFLFLLRDDLVCQDAGHICENVFGNAVCFQELFDLIFSRLFDSSVFHLQYCFI